MSQHHLIRPTLAWGLAGSLLASALALWWSRQADGGSIGDHMPVLGSSAERGLPGIAEHEASAPHRAITAAAAVGTIAAEHMTSLLIPAERDPFHLQPVEPQHVRQPSQAAAAAVTPAAPSATAPPLPLPPPPMAHRVIGHFQTPDGVWLTLLQDGEVAVPASSGLALASGWVVKSLTAQELQLSHPQADRPVSLPMLREPPL